MNMPDKSKQQLLREIEVLNQRIDQLEASEQQHRAVENDLRRAAEEWQSLTENSPDHILTLDEDLKIQFVNFPSPGLTKEELIGTPLYEYVEKERQQEIRGILERVLETGLPDTYETQFHAEDGSLIEYESKAVPLRSSDSGNIIGIILTARNVSNLKKDILPRVLEEITVTNQLPGIIPVCANCHRARSYNDRWCDLISYIAENTDTRFSHGICPDCKKRLYPEVADK